MPGFRAHIYPHVESILIYAVVAVDMRYHSVLPLRLRCAPASWASVDGDLQPEIATSQHIRSLEQVGAWDVEGEVRALSFCRRGVV